MATHGNQPFEAWRASETVALESVDHETGTLENLYYNRRAIGQEPSRAIVLYLNCTRTPSCHVTLLYSSVL